MLIAVRHGLTALNENGETGKDHSEKFRGWLPIPLVLEGMKSSREVAESLDEFAGQVTTLYTSDVVRAVQSAEEIAQVLSIEMTPQLELRDWNLGDYVGQEVAKVLHRVLQHIDDPNKPVPNGETFQIFLDRCVPFLQHVVDSEDLNVIVTHARVIGLLFALAKNKGKHPDTAILKAKCPIDPSGLLILSADWEIVFHTAETPDTP